MIINCTVEMRYYDNASTWTINVSVVDIDGEVGRNDTITFTYNPLSAMSFAVAWINFSSMTLGGSDQAAANPLILNNTGNDDFDQINITAAALIGVDISAQTIAAAQFAVNYTNENVPAGSGLPLSNSPQVIPGVDSTANLTLMHGHSSASDIVISAKGNQSLWFWVDVPSSGLSAQKYNNTWNITVIDLP